MRTMALWVVGVVGVTGCTKGPARVGGDAAAEGGATVAKLDAGWDAAGPEAANELDVARYDDEVAVNHLPLTVKREPAVVTVMYPHGTTLVGLKTGDKVVQLAERNGFFRITFADPKEPTRKLMGWIASPVFEDVALADGGAGDGGFPDAGAFFACRPGQVHVFQAGKSRCAYECGADSECKGGECAVARVLDQNAAITAYTTTCTDPIKPNVKVDPNNPSVFGIPPKGPNCPKFFKLVPKVGTMCYRFCNNDSGCPQDSVCRDVKGTKLCVSAL